MALPAPHTSGACSKTPLNWSVPRVVHMNMIASAKAAQDAIAALIGVDDSKWVPTYRVGEPTKGGMIVFAFPEIPGGKTDAESMAEARR